MLCRRYAAVLLGALASTGCFEEPQTIGDDGADDDATETTDATSTTTTTTVSSGPSTTLPMTDGEPCVFLPVEPQTLPSDVVLAIAPEALDAESVDQFHLDRGVGAWPEGVPNHLALITPPPLTFPLPAPCLTDACGDPSCPVQDAVFVDKDVLSNSADSVLLPATDYECVFRTPLGPEPPMSTRHVILTTYAGGGGQPVDPQVAAMLDFHRPYFSLVCPGCTPAGAGPLELFSDQVFDPEEEPDAVEILLQDAGQPRYVCRWPHDQPGGFTVDELAVTIGLPGEPDIPVFGVPSIDLCAPDSLVFEWHPGPDGENVVLCPATCYEFQRHPAEQVVIEHVWGACPP